MSVLRVVPELLTSEPSPVGCGSPHAIDGSLRSWNALMMGDLVQEMEAYGFHMDDVYQGENLYPVIQEMQGLLEDGNIHIGDNDLLKMHLLNSAIKMSNERGRGKLVKVNSTLHIDGCAALLDALTVRQKWYGEIGTQLRN